MSATRIFVGNLPVDIREREIEDVFRRYGQIRQVDIKMGPGRGPAFAFVEFIDARDADDAIRGEHDRSRFGGERMRVEPSRGPRGGERGGYDRYERYDRYDRGGGNGERRGGLGPSPYGPSRKTSYRVIVSGLEPTMSWQDLKDHFREFKLEVTHADVNRDGTGTASFASEDDMERAVDKADDSVMKNLRGECRIRVKIDSGDDDYGRGRYRSRSPADRSPPPRRSRSRSGSPRYSPAPRREDSPPPRD